MVVVLFLAGGSWRRNGRFTEAASLGVSVQTFDKYGITPVERRWREVFYDVKSVYCRRAGGLL